LKKRSYPKPPILEALCEFQFVSSKPWDLTIPGLMYEKVKDRFPEKRNLRTINVEVRISSEAVEQKVEPTLPRTQFLSRYAYKVLQVAPDLLVVNWLRPYSSWEEFKPVILDAFRKYDAVASPEGFKRIGLRYINKIDFPSARIELQEYLTFYPETPSELADPIGSFFSRVEIPYTESRDLLILTIGSTPAEQPDTASAILSLDYVLAKPNGVDKAELESWLETAHTAVETAFEACVTEKSKALFGGRTT